jgi:hypothetical protein
MQRPRLRFTTRRIMIAVAVLGVGVWAYAEHQRNGTYYAAGWCAAERELWRGEATIWAFGSSVTGGTCSIDPDTGLPSSGGCGCVIRNGDSEWVKGHNDHIAQFIRWNGLPQNTLKPWILELFNLYRYFEIKSRTDVPRRLLVDGPAVFSPDRKNSVRLVSVVKDDGSRGDWLTVVITAGNVVLNKGFIRPDKAESDLLWGPKESRFAVIRSVYDKTEYYAAYDLRTGRLLRDESWDEWKRGWEQARANPFTYRMPVVEVP